MMIVNLSAEYYPVPSVYRVQHNREYYLVLLRSCLQYLIVIVHPNLHYEVVMLIQNHDLKSHRQKVRYL